MIPRRPAVSVEQIERQIHAIGGQKVMLDSDLAALYGISTKRLNEQVKRNRRRFPADFAFQLSRSDAEFLRSQFATSKSHRGGRRYLPYAFTEHGAIMLASVLNTPRAIDVSVYVVRAFVRLRQMLAYQKDVAPKLAELQRRVAGHDEALSSLVEAIRRLMEPPEKGRRSIGFRVQQRGPVYRLRRKRREGLA